MVSRIPSRFLEAGANPRRPKKKVLAQIKVNTTEYSINVP